MGNCATSFSPAPGSIGSFRKRAQWSPTATIALSACQHSVDWLVIPASGPIACGYNPNNSHTSKSRSRTHDRGNPLPSVRSPLNAEVRPCAASRGPGLPEASAAPRTAKSYGIPRRIPVSPQLLSSQTSRSNSPRPGQFVSGGCRERGTAGSQEAAYRAPARSPRRTGCRRP
jgi:hypothetical protein